MASIPPMRTGLGVPSDRDLLPYEKRAMIMCIHHYLTCEGVAVYRLYRLYRYDMEGKKVDDATESFLLKRAMRYVVLCGVGAELEEILTAVIHDQTIENPVLLEKYKDLVTYYPKVVDRLMRGESNVSVATWLVESSEAAVQAYMEASSSEDESADAHDDPASPHDESDEELSLEEILGGVDVADENWTHFIPQTPLQEIVKNAVDRSI